MAVVDAVRERLNGAETNKIPPDVDERLKRGAQRLRQVAPKRNECWEFFRGNQYAYVDDRGVLQIQPTVTSVRGGGKERHRIRRVHDLITMAVQHRVSAATQRVPSYDIAPTTTDPEDISAARLAEKVALYGYDKWAVRSATAKVVTNALVSDEGFAWPYFDNTIGPYIETDNGYVGQGDVCIRVYSGNQVGWEPGSRFEESPWHFVEYGKPLSEVEQMEGFTGLKLKPDAETEALSGKGQNSANAKSMVLVREYLERPNPKHPKGRWVTVANGRRIVPDKDYPCAEYEGFDGNVLHKLSYIIDPDSDRDLGLVRFLLDPQRSFNHAKNKVSEWANDGLGMRVFVTPGLLQRQRITDEPVQLIEVPQPNQNVQLFPQQPIPPELFTIQDRSKDDLNWLAGLNDPPSQIDTARAFEAWDEQRKERDASFYGELAEFHSQLARHCLVLVAEHYTEERLLKVKGRFGWERIADFQGSDLRSQVDVTVFPGSIEPRTKQATEQKVFAFADRGWITPQAAMHAIDTGTSEKLIEDVNLDVARANRVIQRIEEGPDSLFGGAQMVVGIEPDTVPGPPDPMTGQPTPMPNMKAGEPITAPAWMPSRSDNITVWKSVFDSWFKTEDYERLELGMQTAAHEIYAQLLKLEEEKQLEEAQRQNMLAEGQGMENAARPQGPKALPDKTSVSSDGAPGQQPTMNQPRDQSPGPPS